MTADPGPSPSATSAGPVAELQVTEILTGLRAPREVVPLDEGRMLVSDQAGRVVVVSDGQVRTEPFLDLSDQVLEPTS